MLLDKHVWRGITFSPRTSNRDCGSNARNEKRVANKFTTEVEEGAGIGKITFKPLSSNDRLDFPEISVNDLKILFTGTYQLGQAIAYLREIVHIDGDVSDI